MDIQEITVARTEGNSQEMEIKKIDPQDSKGGRQIQNPESKETDFRKLKGEIANNRN